MKNTNLFTYNVGSSFDVEMFEEEVINYGWSLNDVLVSSKDGVWFLTYDVSVLNGDVLIEMLVDCGMEVVI